MELISAGTGWDEMETGCGRARMEMNLQGWMGSVGIAPTTVKRNALARFVHLCNPVDVAETQRMLLK